MTSQSKVCVHVAGIGLRILIIKLDQAENELCHHPRPLSVCGYSFVLITSPRHEVEQELHHERSFEVETRIEELWFIHAGLACPSVLVQTMEECCDISVQKLWPTTAERELV